MKGQTIDSAMIQNNDRADADVGSRIARVDQADPLLEQWICRRQQKQEDTAEKYGDEPHGKARLHAGRLKMPDGVPEKSEWADQVEIAQRRGTRSSESLSHFRLVVSSRPTPSDRTMKMSDSRVEFLDGGQKGGQHDDDLPATLAASCSTLQD